MKVCLTLFYGIRRLINLCKIDLFAGGVFKTYCLSLKKKTIFFPFRSHSKHAENMQRGNANVMYSDRGITCTFFSLSSAGASSSQFMSKEKKTEVCTRLENNTFQLAAKIEAVCFSLILLLLFLVLFQTILFFHQISPLTLMLCAQIPIQIQAHYVPHKHKKKKHIFQMEWMCYHNENQLWSRIENKFIFDIWIETFPHNLVPKHFILFGFDGWKYRVQYDHGDIECYCRNLCQRHLLINGHIKFRPFFRQCKHFGSDKRNKNAPKYDHNQYRYGLPRQILNIISH